MENEKQKLMFLAVASCIPTRENPRTIDEKSEGFRDLVESVRGSGVNIPVHVRPHPTEEGRFDLRDGARRLAAATAAGLDEIPAVIHIGMTDEEAFDFTMVANMEREDLTPFEQSRGVELLIARHQGDVAAVASVLGRSEKWVRLRAHLSNLSDDWKAIIADVEHPLSLWTVGHLVQIARLPVDMQNWLLRNQFNWAEETVGITVSKLESIIEEEIMHRLASSAFDPADAALVKKAGACTVCNKRTGAQAGLFHDATDADTIAREDRCLDEQCYQSKQMAALKVKFDEAKKVHGESLGAVADGYTDYQREKALEKILGPMGRVDGDLCKNPPKKGEATPVFVTTGDHAGEVMYVKAHKGGSSAGGGGSRSKKKGCGTPLAERKRAHNSKRWAWVLERLEKKVRALALKDMTVPFAAWTCERFMLILAMVYGTEENRRYAYPAQKVLDAVDDGNEVEALWLQVRPVIARTVHHAGPITQVNAHEEKNALAVGEVLNIDVNAMFAESVAALPDPKTWKKLEEEEKEKKRASRKGAKAQSEKKQPTTPRKGAGQAPDTKGTKGSKGKAKKKTGARTGEPLNVEGTVVKGIDDGSDAREHVILDQVHLATTAHLYSGDLLTGKTSTIRGLFGYGNDKYACTSCVQRGQKTLALTGYRLLTEGRFRIECKGPVWSYRGEDTPDPDGAKFGGYHGLKVKWDKQDWILAGPPVMFIDAEYAKEMGKIEADESPEETACIGCGCTQTNACEGGCAWVSDGFGELAVCTSCSQGLNGKAAEKKAHKAMREAGIDVEQWLSDSADDADELVEEEA